MMDNIRNVLLIFTSASAIFITANKFFFNLPLNIIKASYKFDCEEASFIESAVGAFVAILYGTMIVVGAASMLIAIFEQPHLTNNTISELPIDKLRQNLFCAMILLISAEVILTLVLMNLKLIKKTNVKIISKIIFFLSLASILASIALFIFECFCYESNTTLMINSKSVNLGNLNLNQVKKWDVKLYLNGNKVVSDSKEYGKLVISNSNINLIFSIN